MVKIYIVEGLPCSGKSTTSKYIKDNLKALGKNAIFADENTHNHPADYDFHAYLKEDELLDLDEKLVTKIMNNSTKVLNGYIIDLDLFKDNLKSLIKYKIYDSLPWDVEEQLLLEKWISFVNNAKNDDNIYVFNCIFLQNPMCETMMRFNLTFEESFKYVFKIYDIIKVLNPVIIYLKNDDIASQIKKTSLMRNDWLDAVINYHVNGEYGKSINATGFTGYISCLQERQKRELSILSKLPINKLVIENASRDWEKAYKEISNYLKTNIY